MNKFGGEWTKNKIEILVEYAKAYLTIMNDRKFFKLLYFDGFAGTGFIVQDQRIDVALTVGAARRIIEISRPRPFDLYYFVEKDLQNFSLLEENTKLAFPKKKIFTNCDDCNKKMIDLSNFLRDPKNSSYRTLAYIDPCGMQVEWRSLENLRGLPIDMWILVPTGMGVNRLLATSGQISDAWLEKLELFLGMSREDIKSHFYKKRKTLFEEIDILEKEKNAVELSANLYQRRLKEIFTYVSKGVELKNSANSIMYHLFFASNNKAAVKIGNDIIKKYDN